MKTKHGGSSGRTLPLRGSLIAWCSGAVLALLLAAAPATGEDVGWPVEIEADGGWTVTLYQPQVDSFEGNRLETRAAVSVTGPGWPDPVFGAVWITARLEISRERRLVRVVSVEVPEVRFVEASEEGKKKLAALLEREIPSWNIEISLDRFLADLEVEIERASVQGLNHEPPAILFSTEPALLVAIDGEPILVDVPGQVGQSHKVQYVLNTPFPVLYDPRSQYHYLCGGGELWYRSPRIEGPWEVSRAVPSIVKFLIPEEERAVAGRRGGGGQPPKVIVVGEPTELIVSAGEPRWEAIEGLDLSYLGNSDRDVIVDRRDNSIYVPLSGRWYRSQSFAGPWQFVEPGQLPATFQMIPADSPVGGVRAHVAGTQEAREAVLDAQIPETAVVKRSATIRVRYDGPPQFEPIKGTDLEYATNTASQVFKVGEGYYCCEQGVWYVANGPKGPWRVCDQVPDAISDIPPSNPNYNVTYVEVYDATPEVVYVGYSSGYLGSYSYGGCMVYGTGWHYPAWYGSSYYPGQSTWGFHSMYDPWTGSWGFGVGWSNGPITISIGVAQWGGYSGAGWGWFGVGGYAPYPHAYPYPGYTRPGSGVIEGYVPVSTGGGGGGTPYGSSLYSRSASVGAVTQGYGDAGSRGLRYSSGRANDVYADDSGNIYRRNQNGGWDVRSGGGWNPSLSSPQSLQSDHQSRERGSQRAAQVQSRRR